MCWSYFLYIIFGGLQCVSHSFAYVAHFRDMSGFEPRPESCCSKQARYATNLAMHPSLSYYTLHFKRVIIKTSKMFSLYTFFKMRRTITLLTIWKGQKIYNKEKTMLYAFNRISSFRAMESGSESIFFGNAGSGSAVIEWMLICNSTGRKNMVFFDSS
jgi:hypothetical protein